MELFKLFVIICVLTSVTCAGFTVNLNGNSTEIPKSLNKVKGNTDHTTPPHGHVNDKAYTVELPTYSLYLIGFTMLIMLIAIIGLAVALFLMIKNKPIFGHNISKKEYVRQESTGVATLYNSNYDEQNKNNGSTLTMNSGIIEINRVSEPATPTRLEESKIIFTKRPIKPIVPVIQRGQMDAICKEVLSKVQKSDSASFRDLNELLSGKNEDKYEAKYDALKELEKEKINETKAEVENESQQETKFNTVAEAIAKMNSETQNGTKYVSKNETLNDTKKEIQFDNKNETINETKPEIKHEASQDVQIAVSNEEAARSTEDSETETEYDTVPSPIRYRHSGLESDDFDVDNVYDLPPRRSYDGKPRNMIHLDPDSQYLMPISPGTTESCYINAKRNSYNSSS